LTQKPELRSHYFSLRDAIPSSRRLTAAQALFARFCSHPARNILTFMPYASEIDILPLNRHLALEGRLILPRRRGTALDFFQITDLDTQLEPIPPGILEPIPSRSIKVSKADVHLILATGLAFDENRYRLGYGKGHYDRLLQDISIPIIGVGFIEQKSPMLLPHDDWDVAMTEVFLC
jgi:5-formyltetrahydrofolate cyclo-ligase